MGGAVPLRVIICDERPMISDGLGSFLSAESDIDVIGSAPDEDQAMMLVRSRSPDVVLTGLRLGATDVTEFVRRLHEDAVEPAVVVYTEDAKAGAILCAGAMGVLAADASAEELLLAIRAAGHGQMLLGPSVARWLADWLLPRDDDHDARRFPEADELTRRELEILTLIGQGLCAGEIADRLYLGVATVRTHIYRMRCKLRLRDRAQLVTFAYEAGLMRAGRTCSSPSDPATPAADTHRSATTPPGHRSRRPSER